MKNYLYILIGLVLIIASCKKEAIPELSPTAGSDGIYFSGMLGTEPISLNSKGNYYMYSSFTFDSIQEVYVFTGELKERYCTDCGTGIKLKVTNYKKSPGGVINFDLDSILTISSINWESLSAVELGLAEIIIDKNDGNPVLSSRSCYQSASNKLLINSVEYYNKNELGQNTVKVQFEGEVYITNSTGDELFTFNGSFAFAYP